mmetsp:Transcript_13833/g.21582  ORF Transcript_13833/g.21582 Transcript_13833/m.21582 type:complete len:166 (+) Transcript_13833:174-671(+)|eukprot:CAMPEP_0184309506 /NCGR_PEP_ID=MMETSP1049-20130417/17648_1 /TAXON_ID=77928 /ORGANISM="Proteomonas sulcata, Strain CCMP704" /LENGTH=165 /DNA_ID=CAMNT_0026622395 /DNA_START=140 /DNA_END=637 /DNA_ORIENTATION=+
MPGQASIGIALEKTDRGLVVSGLAPKSPAQGKLQKGDLIVTVDGKEAGSNPRDLASKLQGAEGSIAKLSVKRKGIFGDETLQLQITRAKLQTQSKGSGSRPTSAPLNLSALKDQVGAKKPGGGAKEASATSSDPQRPNSLSLGEMFGGFLGKTEDQTPNPSKPKP